MNTLKLWMFIAHESNKIKGIYPTYLSSACLLAILFQQNNLARYVFELF